MLEDKIYRVLILEDNKYDAKLLLRQLNKLFKEFEHIVLSSAEGFEETMKSFLPDIILSDYNLGLHTGLEVLETAKVISHNIPFIMVTGVMSEETAVTCLKQGAWDYVLKDKIFKLGPAIERAFEVQQEIIEKENAEEELRTTNQQLITNEEELIATNKQLIANEQQLRTTNQQLLAKEKELKEKSQLLEDTGRMARVGGWQIDLETNNLTWSEETFRIHEIPLSDEIVVEKAIKFFHPDDQPILQEALQNATEKGEPYDLTLRFITAKGKHLITRTLCRTESIDGKVVRLKGTFQDITEWKKAEEALRKSDERFRIAQDISPDGFTILHPIRDDQGNVIDFSWIYENKSVSKWNGTDPEKIAGKRLLEIFPGHKDTQFLKNYIRVAESGKPITFEDSYSGETIDHLTWFRVTVFPMEDDIAILSQDITKRKETECEILEHQHQLKVLREIGILATSTLDLKELLQRILRGALDGIGANAGMIFLKDMTTAQLSLGAFIGLSEAFVSEYENSLIEPGEGLSGRISESGKVIFIKRDSSHDYRISRQVVIDEKLNSFIGVPIFDDEQIIGVMNILSRAPQELNEHNVALAQAIGSNIGSAVKNARLHHLLIKTKEELKEKVRELETFNDASVNREIVINNQRKEINELLKKLGKKEKFSDID